MTLRRVLVIAALLYPVTYVVVALLRLSYPFELEWLEGLALEHVGRIVAGQPIYVAPTLSFIPFNYTPLYFYAAALPAMVLGVDFMALRLVSLVASLGCLGLLFALVRRETGSMIAAALAACLYAATYRLSGAWFDIARPDSLYLLLILAALAALRLDPSRWRAAIAAGVLFSLAFLAKQSALVVAAPVILYMIVTELRPGFLLIATMVVLVGGSTLLLDRLSHGWYGYYIFAVARRHSMDLKQAAVFWTKDLMTPLAIASVLSLFYLMVRRPEGRGGAVGFYGAAAAGMIGSSWMLRMFPGGYDNVLMPAYAALALLFGLGWALVDAWSQRPSDANPIPLRRFLDVACIVQFALLPYPPGHQIPSRADREAGQHLLEGIRRLPGEILVPSHSYLAARAGKAPHFHENAFFDVVTGGTHPTETGLADELRAAMRNRRYSALVLDQRDGLLEVASPTYRVQWPTFNNDTVFWTRTGMRTRPEAVLVPRE